MADAWAPPPPRDAGDQPSIDQALERIDALWEWANENDPQPPWWQRRARRAWRAKWGITP